ncbi:hypothetical protein BD289DRAFT_437310 [Coniella lustricola]|uniref:BTB domain transcription factor n=1 Tax=Coniella lustricola TaxID=2025994 RepID=A0A2T3A464_9PEZI|nr:hypothetical protein BD289DRAFT_437310 [Coniella lustricola]
MTQTRSGRSTAAGDKHKLDEAPASPPAKAQRKSSGAKAEKQLTLDESLGVESEVKEEIGNDDNDDDTEEEKADGVAKKKKKSADQSDGTAAEPRNEEDSAVKAHGRGGALPASILEKGIIYFFFRGRIDIEHPEKVDDIARTYIILRPIPLDAKLTDGPIGDAGNSRLIAVPKKKLPRTGKDRWIAFVDKTNASFDQLKKEFLASNDYTTQAGLDRHSPAASPFGEGVYAITTTGRESHLAYFLTLPEKLGDVQTDLGLKEKGSWILSTRNPKYPAPPNVAFPEAPDYPQEIFDEFRSRRWMGTLPKHLIPKAQFLLIGESSGVDQALKADEKDTKATERPIEEMEQLEHEDMERMEHLGKDASEAIFTDLEAQASGYPKLQTTF